MINKRFICLDNVPEHRQACPWVDHSTLQLYGRQGESGKWASEKHRVHWNLVVGMK